MLGFGKKKRESTAADAADRRERRQRLFSRLKDGLATTRAVLYTDVGDLLRGRKRIDEDLLEELETQLLAADVGVDATTRIIDDISGRVKRRELSDPQALLGALKEQLRDILVRAEAPVHLISVELEGVATKLMSYMWEGTPSFGLPIKAKFHTDKPTNTILDLCWVPA